MSITNDSSAAPINRMTVRKVPFTFRSEAGHWNAAKPEFSQVVNAASLAMPYLEPYLIRTMRAARPLISDPQLQSELDLYIKQEATHYKQHRQFNNTLQDKGYVCVADIEETLDKDYRDLEARRSLRFNLAYAEGFESMALALGEMLIEDRVYLFGDSDPGVASLVLWHFVEEIEHKNVAFDVFHHLYGSYFWRMVGLVYASGHIFWRTGQGYRALLKEDGLWQDRKSRWTLLKLLGRLVGSIAPRWLRILRPGYHPRQIQDPAWGLHWAQAFERSPDAVAHLNTADLGAAIPAT
jgi:hypothetical protein